VKQCVFLCSKMNSMSVSVIPATAWTKGPQRRCKLCRRCGKCNTALHVGFHFAWYHVLTLWHLAAFWGFLKKHLNARGFAREFLQSGKCYRPCQSVKRRGKSFLVSTQKKFQIITFEPETLESRSKAQKTQTWA